MKEWIAGLTVVAIVAVLWWGLALGAALLHSRRADRPGRSERAAQGS